MSKSISIEIARGIARERTCGCCVLLVSRMAGGDKGLAAHPEGAEVAASEILFGVTSEMIARKGREEHRIGWV